MMWFSVKIRFKKTLESGLVKKVNETILVDAMSFTEAEARAIEEMKPFISGEFSVEAIKKEIYQEVQPCNRDGELKWYKVRAAYITLDEKSGNEKKSYENHLIQSVSTAEAEKDYKQMMTPSMIDYEIVAVTETNIIDVYIYQEEAETEETK